MTHDGPWPLCETCGAVPTRHNDYNDCIAHRQVVGQAFGAGLEEGARRERERIVAELRASAAHLDSLVPRDASPVSHQHLRRSRDALTAAADALERDASGRTCPSTDDS